MVFHEVLVFQAMVVFQTVVVLQAVVIARNLAVSAETGNAEAVVQKSAGQVSACLCSTVEQGR